MAKNSTDFNSSFNQMNRQLQRSGLVDSELKFNGFNQSDYASPSSSGGSIPSNSRVGKTLAEKYMPIQNTKMAINSSNYKIGGQSTKLKK